MKNKAIWLFLLFALLCLCAFALLPLFHAGYFTMHDDEQIGRLQQMYLVLSQGQIPPRWVPDLGFGFGYPLFNFYPPLVYYIGSFFHVAGFSFIDSTKIVMGLGFFLAAVTMFVWVKKHYGIIPGFFAALLYTYAPYHSVDLYVRGALSEFFSWIWIPAIFLAMDMLFETTQKKYIIILGLCLALLMLSHSLVMLQFSIIFPLYAVFLFLQSGRNCKKKLRGFSIAILLGLGLSAYFWIPSLLEKQYTLVDSILTKQLANYAMHFVCPIQLWSSPWGYGGSAGGCVDGLSLQIGKIQIIVATAGILTGIFFVLKKKIFLPLAVSLIFLLSLFMTLPYSKFIWDSEKAFWYIQFPWRFLLFVAVGSAFLGGFILSCIQRKWGRIPALVIGIILSLLAMYQIRNYFKPQAYRYVTDADMTSPLELQWRVSSMSYEYVPKDVPTRLSAQKTTKLDISYTDLPVTASYGTGGDVQLHAKELTNLANLKRYEVNVYNTSTYSPAELQINTFSFPGWKVYVDGKEDTHVFTNGIGAILIELPLGKHLVEARFTNTPIRTVSNSISLITACTLIGSFLFMKRRKI